MFKFPQVPCVLIGLGLAASLFTGCADTVLQRGQAAEGVASLHFTKVMVIAITPDNFNRRMAEAAVKGKITKIPSVGSYEVIPSFEELKDKAKVIQAVKDQQVDGVVVLRLLSNDTNVFHGSGSSMPAWYGDFGTYYGMAYDMMSAMTATNSLYVNFVYGIETNIYDAKTGKLVWTGLTQSTKDSTNYRNIPGLIREVSDTIRAELVKQKLIQP